MSAEFDFKTRPDRSGQGSSKWDEMISEAGGELPDGVVPLSVADMELEIAPQIKRALHEFVDCVVPGYTEPTDAYYEACIGWQRRRHDWTPKREWLTLSPGVVPAINASIRALTAPGDGVIIQPPVYYPFEMAIRKNGRKVVENPLKLDGTHYEIDFDDLERKAANPNTTAIVVCSPHNPVGRVWTPEELGRLVRICLDNGLFVICDEIHNDLIMPGIKHTTLLNVVEKTHWDRCLVCTAPSKTFNLAGLQSSNIYIPDETSREAFDNEFRGVLGFLELNAFGYAATTAAYNECGDWLDELIGLVQTNYEVLLDMLSNRLPEIRVFPLEGTYLAWADFNAWGLSPDELKRFMRESAYLYLDEGHLFGPQGDGFERFNLAAPTSVIRESLTRLCDAADKCGVRSASLNG